MRLEVPLARPFFGQEEAAAVRQVLSSGWVSQGPQVEKFEKRLASLLHCLSVSAVNSGTSALMLTLRALNVGPGDSVVVPAFTCAATALPILETGATPLFADIDPASFNVTWDAIERVLDENTKAVIVVHMFGRVADMDVIVAQCKKRKLALVEDAALALGARKGDCFAGTFGVAGCFSFHPRKLVTTGEGGAICTDDPVLSARVRSDRNYGAAQTAWARFQTGDGSLRGFSRIGFNSKLTDLQAAIGRVQLTRLSKFISRRREIAKRYSAELANCGWLALPSIPHPTHEHVFQAFVCTWRPAPLPSLLSDPARLRSASKALNAFKETMIRRRVAVSEAAQFLPTLPVFAQKRLHAQCPNAYLASQLAFALPIYPSMTESDLKKVVAAVKGGIAGY